MGQHGSAGHKPGDHLSSVRCDGYLTKVLEFGYPLAFPFFREHSKGRFQDDQHLETRPDLPFAYQDR